MHWHDYILALASKYHHTTYIFSCVRVHWLFSIINFSSRLCRIWVRERSPSRYIIVYSGSTMPHCTHYHIEFNFIFCDIWRRRHIIKATSPINRKVTHLHRPLSLLDTFHSHFLSILIVAFHAHIAQSSGFIDEIAFCLSRIYTSSILALLYKLAIRTSISSMDMSDIISHVDDLSSHDIYLRTFRLAPRNTSNFSPCRNIQLAKFRPIRHIARREFIISYAVSLSGRMINTLGIYIYLK